MSEKTVIGVDVGGSKVAIAAYSAKHWRPLRSITVALPSSATMEIVCTQIVSIVKGFCSTKNIYIGVGIPGIIDNHGKIRATPHIEESINFPLQKTLEKALGAHVVIENDSRCFALAEATYGAGRGFSTVAGLTIGTGVGGGIVHEGSIIRGSHGTAGEFGHMLLVPGKPPYRSRDRRGDAEQFISGTALRKRCEEALHPTDIVAGTVCLDVTQNMLRELAWLISSITYSVDPEIIVLGGTVGASLEPHLQFVERELLLWLLKGTTAPHIRVAKRKDAGTLGAALLTQSLMGCASTVSA
jgi:glucokinase